MLETSEFSNLENEDSGIQLDEWVSVKVVPSKIDEKKEWGLSFYTYNINIWLYNNCLNIKILMDSFA